MTSYDAPDFEMKLHLSQSEFKELEGNEFEVKVTCRDGNQGFKGMLMIHQSDNSPRRDADCSAWLWAFDQIDFEGELEVMITLGAPCDSMVLYDDGINPLDKFVGTRLNGVITARYGSSL